MGGTECFGAALNLTRDIGTTAADGSSMVGCHKLTKAISYEAQVTASDDYSVGCTCCSTLAQAKIDCSANAGCVGVYDYGCNDGDTGSSWRWCTIDKSGSGGSCFLPKANYVPVQGNVYTYGEYAVLGGNKEADWNVGDT